MHAVGESTRRRPRGGGVPAIVFRSPVRLVRWSFPVEISPDIMAGVVSLPHGYGHHRTGTKIAIANSHAGISCNDVTDAQYIDQLSGNAAVNGLPVSISLV